MTNLIEIATELKFESQIVLRRRLRQALHYALTVAPCPRFTTEGQRVAIRHRRTHSKQHRNRRPDCLHQITGESSHLIKTPIARWRTEECSKQTYRRRVDDAGVMLGTMSVGGGLLTLKYSNGEGVRTVVHDTLHPSVDPSVQLAVQYWRVESLHSQHVP